MTERAPQHETIQTLRERAAGLRNHISVPVRDAIALLQSHGHEAWLAGGCVRDLLLGRIPDDFDVATSALPEVVQKIYPRTIPTGLKHGTVTVLVPDAPSGKLEVTTFRGEGPYSDGRRPEHVEFITDLDQDLARRDFTINAMALDPVSGELRDPFGGISDLVQRRVRCVGEPALRFGEDGLRVLRAVRFSSVLQFALDAPTKAAITEAVPTFRKVARERMRDELIKLLVGSAVPSRGIALLAETGLLAEMLPELLEGQGVVQNRAHEWDVWTHTLHVVDAAPRDLTVRLAALLHDVAKPRSAVPIEGGEHTFHGHELVGAVLADDMLERLRFPRKLIESVSHLVRQHNWFYQPEWTDGTVRRHLRQVGVENLPAFYALREADIRGHGRGLAEGLENLAQLRARFDQEEGRASALSIKDLALTGTDLMSELGKGPGSWVGDTLRGLLEHVLDEPDDNSRERLLSLARQRLGS